MNRTLRTAGMAIASVAFAVSILLLIAPYVAPAVFAESPSWASPIVLAFGLVGIVLFNLGNKQNKATL
jgi:hypothetical protein